jgi:hypothetical protein
VPGEGMMVDRRVLKRAFIRTDCSRQLSRKAFVRTMDIGSLHVMH